MKKYELVKKTNLTSKGYEVYYCTNCDGKFVSDSVRFTFDEAVEVFKIIVDNNGIVEDTEILLTVEK